MLGAVAAPPSPEIVAGFLNSLMTWASRMQASRSPFGEASRSM